MEGYKVVKRIGVGTYGSAYLVSVKNDPAQQYVLKKIKIDEDDLQERKQAELEVTVLSQLDHPLVLGYVDHFMYKGHLCIVTDYCESGDLYSLLRARKTPLLEAQLLEWLVQVVLAIQYVHAKNILHRDLKTQNIFLTKENNIKLGDFGISRPLNGALDLASTIIGTPYYMSPEVMSSQPYDYKSDMWSLGCCVYEMMTGKHAFDASDMSSLVMKIMRGEHLPIPNQFSPDLRDLTKSLLSKNPKLRPSPDTILKMPWLKEYVARTRDKVARIERPARQRTSTSGSFPSAPSAPAGLSNAGRRQSEGAAGLDRELEVAKARLRKIQAERDALALAAAASRQAAAAAAAGGRPGASELPPQAIPPMRPPLPPAGVPISQQGMGWRGSREDSPAQGASYSSTPPQELMMDPKARKEARRQEEIRQREAELREARKAYFEERKQAEVMKRHMIHGNTANTGFKHRSQSQTGDASRELSGLGLDSDDDDPGQASSRSAASASKYGGKQYAGGYGHHRAQSVNGPGADGAAAEFEEELRHRSTVQGPGAALLRTFGGAGGSGSGMIAVPVAAPSTGPSIIERASAIREICVNALGLQLFDLIYSVVRKRLGNVGEEAYFRQELTARLGPHRMQYLHLVDQLVYCEDLAGVGP